MGLTAAAEPVFPDVIGFREAFVHVAPLDVAGDVDVPLEAFVDLGGVLLDSVEGLEDARKHFIVHFDESRACSAISSVTAATAATGSPI